MARTRGSKSEEVVGLRLGRILIGTDFSAGARAALSRVAKLPLEPRVEIILSYVIPAGGDLFVDRGAELSVQKLLEEETRVLRRLLPRTARVRNELVRGRPFDALFELGARLEPELVVMGRHGERAFRDDLLGSTAERVLQLANRPVLVVSRTAKRPYKKALAAVDLEPGSMEILATGLRVSGVTPKQISLVHAFRGEGDGLPGQKKKAGKKEAEQLRESRLAAVEAGLRMELTPFPALKTNAQIVISEGDAREVLVEQVAQQKADLLVVGTHGRIGYARAVLGSVAQSLARRAPCDVLVVPTPLSER